MNIFSFFKININNIQVIKRLKKLPQKLPYDLYEYSPTGIKLMINEATETTNPSTAKEMTRFLNLIIPIHVKSESNENTIANNTVINTRSPIPNPKLNINPSPLKEIKNENIPMIQVISDIRPTMVKIVLRYGCNL